MCPVVAFWDKNILTVQSKVINGILLFKLRIHKNLQFQTFHYGVKRFISSPLKNHKNTVNTWSTLEEIIQNLNSMVFNHKKYILSLYFDAMAPKMV